GFGGALTFLNVWASSIPSISGLAYNISTDMATATGTPSNATETLTGFQTLVTNTSATPAEVEWVNPVDVFAPGLNPGDPASIVKLLPALPAGKFLWVRVQEGAVFSLPISVQVASIAPTVSSVGLNGGILTADGASDPTLNIDAFQVFVNTGASPVVGDWVTPLVEPVAIPAPLVSISHPISANGGDTIWVRVRDSLGGWSDPGLVVVPTPEVQLATFVAPNQLTIVAVSSASTANITAAEWSLGLAAAPAGTGTGVTSSLFGNPAYSETITIPAPIGPDTIWVRVQDSNGTWSDALGVPVA
ncbi:MAG: hypothetical protein Q8M17_08620, partial [Actinomycetota bacterium]|nr:hypothetical protein [Actinomycetota bacterium]